MCSIGVGICMCRYDVCVGYMLQCSVGICMCRVYAAV